MSDNTQEQYLRECLATSQEALAKSIVNASQLAQKNGQLARDVESLEQRNLALMGELGEANTLTDELRAALSDERDATELATSDMKALLHEVAQMLGKKARKRNRKRLQELEAELQLCLTECS